MNLRWAHAVLIMLSAALPGGLDAAAQGAPGQAGGAGRTAQTQRLEGEAILALADAALEGRPVPVDFRVEWQNDFLKAQRGTFVPFTLTVLALWVMGCVYNIPPVRSKDLPYLDVLSEAINNPIRMLACAVGR